MRATKIVGLLVAVVMGLAACSGPGGGATGGGSASGGDTLYLYNWGEYIDPGVIDLFQEETGISVVVDTYESNEDMIAKVRAGGSGYDLVVPSDYAVQLMAAEGLLAPLEQTKLGGLSNIDALLKGLYFDKANTYSVPYLYGTTGIAYSRQVYPNGVDSWAALFEPALLEAVRGKASMLDDEREAPGAALHFLGESLNSTDPEAHARARDLLLAQKPFLASYNSSNLQRLLAGGEYVIAQVYSGDALLARRGLEDEFSGNPDIAYVIPQEGGTIWMDNLAILNDAASKEAAHQFINFMLRPEIAAQNAEYVGYLTPNQAARDLLSDETRALYAEGFAPDADTYERLEWIERGEGSELFGDLWAAVKGE